MFFSRLFQRREAESLALAAEVLEIVTGLLLWSSVSREEIYREGGEEALRERIAWDIRSCHCRHGMSLTEDMLQNSVDEITKRFIASFEKRAE